MALYSVMERGYFGFVDRGRGCMSSRFFSYSVCIFRSACKRGDYKSPCASIFAGETASECADFHATLQKTSAGIFKIFRVADYKSAVTRVEIKKSLKKLSSDVSKKALFKIQLTLSDPN